MQGIETRYFWHGHHLFGIHSLMKRAWNGLLYCMHGSRPFWTAILGEVRFYLLERTDAVLAGRGKCDFGLVIFELKTLKICDFSIYIIVVLGTRGIEW